MASIMKQVLDRRSALIDSYKILQLQIRLPFSTTGSASVKPRVLTGSCTTSPLVNNNGTRNWQSLNSSLYQAGSAICTKFLPTSTNNSLKQGLIYRLCHNITNTEDHDQEIYQGILATQIKLVKTFSLMTSCIGLAFQPVLYTYSSSAGSMVAMVAAGTFLSFFTFATPLLIHSISKKYVTKLYYNEAKDKYTAVVYSLFLKPRKIEFKLSDVQVPDIPGMFTTFKARNVPLFVEGSQFNEPMHYGKIMGFDKPLDLRWDPEMDMTQAEAEAQKRK